MPISRIGPRACAAGVVLALFGALNAPSKADAPSAGELAAGGVGAGIVATTNADGSLSVDYGRADRNALVRRLDPRVGVSGSLDVTRAELKRELGLDLPDLHPESRLTTFSPPPEPQPEPVPEVGAVGWPSPAYDLSGDGADDALIFEFDLAARRIIATRAVDGRTGSELWRLSGEGLADAIALPVDDMTGDGRADIVALKVIVLSNTSVEACDASKCTEEVGETFRWTRALISGADGGVAWSDSIDGSWLYRETTEWTENTARSSESYARTFDAVNYLIAVFPGGDYDHDGLPDVVTDEVDLRVEYSDESSNELVLFSERTTKDSLRATTRALVRSGKDGATLSSHTSDAAPVLSALLPTSDLVGDESLDLLWSGHEYDDFESSCASVSLVVLELADCENDEYRWRFVIKAVDGETLDEAWVSHGAHGFQSFYIDAPDVSGDGTADLLRIDLHDASFEVSTVVVSGAIGAELFRMSGYPLYSGVDLSGSGPTGLVTVDVFRDENHDPVVRIERWDGATGAQLSATERPVSTGIEDPNFGSYGVFTAGDVGGTPSPDILTSVAEADSDGEDVAAQASTWRIEDGRGALLSEGRADGRMRRLAPLADLNGDDAFEALDYDLVIEIDSVEGHLSWTEVNRGIQQLADDTRLWSLADNDYGLSLAGNQDGEGPQELFVQRTTVSADGRQGTAISSLDGATGAVRWTITI